MKKSILTIIASVCALTLTAAPLSPEQSLQRIKTEKAGARFASAPMTLAYTAAETEVPAYYVFNAANGYVIAGADDLAAPMLGYVDNGSFDYNNIPDQMRWWLSQYAQEIDNARRMEGGIDRNRQVRMERPTRPSINPMVNTRWNQGDPYNTLAPLYDGTNRAATGCVATAMAQVLRYYKYPAQGSGSHSYTYNGISHSFNFGNTTFDWANMLHIYTNGNYNTTQAKAVYTLMRACGVAVDMMYGASSGAYSNDVPIALTNYFKYSPSAYLANRGCYTLYDWEDLIYSELATRHPLYYSGHGSAGGHAFVCDGYEGDGYFHFNWGWAGSSDGYFLLGALNPTTLGIGGGGGGFNMGQGAIIGLRPTTTGSPKIYLCYADPFAISYSGSSITLTGFGANYGTTTLSSVRYCFRLTDVNNPTKQTIIRGSLTSNLKPRYGLSSNSASITTANRPANGTYIVEPMFQVKESSTSNEVECEAMMPPSERGRFRMVVNGSSITISDQKLAQPTVTDFSINTPMFKGSNFNFTAKYSNTGSADFYNAIYIGWFNSSNSLLGLGDAMQTTIQPGETQNIDMTVAVPSSITTTSSNTYNLSTNTTYKLALIYSNGTSYVRLTDYQSVTIKAAQSDFNMSASNLRVENAGAVDATDIHFSLDITCPNGFYYTAPIYYWVRKNVGGTYTSIYSANTGPLTIGSNETKHIETRFQFDGAEVGTTYQLLLNYRPVNSNKYLGQADFTVGTTGVNGIVADTDAYSLICNGDNAEITAPAPIAAIRICNMQGMVQTTRAALDGTRATADLSTLGKGIYLLQVITTNGVNHTFRMVR